MPKRIKRKGRRLCYRLVNGRKRLRRCGCGGSPGCCFCVGSGPGCSVPLHNDCTVLDCCCGSWFRVELTSTQRAETPALPGKFRQIDIVGHIETDCNDPTHNSTANVRHVTGISNGGTPIDYFEESPPFPSNIETLRSMLCRPTPREVFTAAVLFNPKDGILNQPMKPPDVIWTAGNCSGQYVQPPGVITYEWSTLRADCDGVEIEWRLTRNDGGYNVVGSAAFKVIRKDAGCCPGDDGRHISPSGPGTPVDPGFPGGKPGCSGCGQDGGAGLGEAL